MSTPIDISLMPPPPPPPSTSPTRISTPSSISSSISCRASPSGSFSTDQLLAVPPAPLQVSVPVPYRPAHNSSKNNAKYHAILLSSLVVVTGATVQRFKKFTSSLSTRFDSTLALPFKGYCILSEADVVTYLESQALYAAWQAVLEMVPTVSGYELMTTKQFSIERECTCTPDQMFVKQFRSEDGSTSIEEFAIIEVKAPGYVRGLFHDIERRQQPGYTYTANWVAITQQLRKYVINSLAKDIIVMDESAAIYFQFSDEPEDEYNNVEFLTADTTQTSPLSPFSLRGLVAFVCWRALKKSGVKFTNSAPDGKAVQSTPVQDPDSAPGPRKRSRSGGSGGGPPDDNGNKKRTRQQTIGEGSGYSSITKFAGWTVGLSFDLSLDAVQCGFPRNTQSPSKTPGGLQLRPPSPHSFDSCCDDLGSSPCCGSEHSPREIRQPPRGCSAYRVEHVFTDHVAQVSSPEAPGRWIAKFFSPTPTASEYLANEVRVYNLCHPLQGREIPYAYGLAVIPNVPGRVLIMECISPGIPIADIQEAAENGDAAAKCRLHKLAGVAESPVCALHKYGVVHNDLYGRNLLVSEGQDGEEAVVVVDFDVAMVFEDGTGRKQCEDWAVLRATFGLEEELR